MSKMLIGSLVAAAIAFIWQAMSWMALGVHDNTLKYSANQDPILAAIAQNLTEEGVYAIPNVPPGTSQADHEAFSNAMLGNPSALVHFTPSFHMNMGAQMPMGFLINLIAALIMAYVMTKTATTFGSRLMVGLGFAVFTVFQSSLMMANWWYTPMHYLSGEIIDTLMGWGLASVWLAWWFGRKAKTA